MADSLLGASAHQAKKLAALATGKAPITALETGHAANAAAQGSMGAFSGTVFSLVVMPIVVGVGMLVAQMDHWHRRRMLRDDYAEEIGAIVGKRTREVTTQDMDSVAFGDEKRGIAANPGLRETLQASARERTDMWMLSIISSVFTLTAVHMLSGAGMPLAGMEGVGMFAAKLVVGLGTYLAIKQPLHMLASWINGIDKPSVADRALQLAESLERGETLGKAQVFGIYLQATPDLNELIRRDFGQKFSHLRRAQQDQAMAQYGPIVRLEEVTQKLNLGMIKPQEIAFDAYNQKSGVGERAPQEFSGPSANNLGKMGAYLRQQLTTMLSGKRSAQNPYAVSQMLDAMHEHQTNLQKEFDQAVAPLLDEGAAPSDHFRSRISARGNPASSHVAQLLQEREAALLQAQSVQTF